MRVLTGKDRGKEGVVMKVIPTQNKVVVEGVNIAKKHQKAKSATSQGGIIDKDMPLPVANVAVLAPPTDGPPGSATRSSTTAPRSGSADGPERRSDGRHRNP